ncbi:MAG TPA: hypothetical protein VM184_09365 [Gaiellaceae bacterium]|nr:hypothetical protein [Gaiellaceae bacterium]
MASRAAAALALAILAGAGVAITVKQTGPTQGGPASCEPLVLGRGYVASVNAALRSKADVWGNRLLARPGGPTYQNVKGLLKPLLLVGRPAGRSGTRLTESGVHYVPMGEPGGRSFADGGPTEPFALHVADGSQLLSRRANGRRATISVGAAGTERYGSCLRRLGEPRLADGYLPVLTVRYTDAQGVRYVQESLVARDPGTGALASYVRIEAARGSSRLPSTQVRVAVSDPAPTAAGGELRSGGRTVLAFSAGGTFDRDGGLRYRLDLTDGDVVYLVRPIDPTAGHLRADAPSFAAARSAAIAAWERRLAEGAGIEVPEPLVMSAMRNLLIQNLQLAWRYSVGNVYEAFYQPESSAAVLRLAEYGFLGDAREALEALLPRSRGRSTNWEQGEKLAAAAAYYLLSGDAAFVREHSPTYAGYARDFAARRAASVDGSGLLDKQRYSGDINQLVYGLHHQSRAWRGLRDMAYVWGLVGQRQLAARYRAEARSFARSLRAAIGRSSTSVSARETFVPIALLSTPREAPWDPVTATREGSYWNLVAPYGWASGIMPRKSALALEVLEYARRRGSFLLGLVRLDYYPTGVGKVRCDGLPGLKTPGVNNVYGVHRVHFLADLDRPDLLVLALYAKLAHGMTRGTFIAGEGDTIGPVPPGACAKLPSGEYHRSMYLPPSSANNDFFLAILRESLAHWFALEDGRPQGLQLAHATPRAWLAHGRRIAVRDLPTPFGPLSYSIDSRIGAGYLDVDLTVPSRRRIGELKLRVRVPPAKQVRLARIGGETLAPDGETFDLTGRTGRLTMRVFVRDRS